jgi:uncharacterized protein YrzB (UPF0473 family)
VRRIPEENGKEKLFEKILSINVAECAEVILVGRKIEEHNEYDNIVSKKSLVRLQESMFNRLILKSPII